MHFPNDYVQAPGKRAPANIEALFHEFSFPKQVKDFRHANSSRKVEIDSSYLCFHLRSESLSSQAENLLVSLGIECLMDGGRYRAYGIVSNPNAVIHALRHEREIVSIEREEPPSYK